MYGQQAQAEAQIGGGASTTARSPLALSSKWLARSHKTGCAAGTTKDRALRGEQKTMNLTPVDKNRNRIECECTFAQRFTNKPGGANRVVLTFEDTQMAKEVFHFVWGKAMGRPMSWLKDEKNKEEAGRPAEVSPSPRS
jgi:hypothetical protein